ncbi:MAG TPA: tetratricopeptide repeat protein [Bacteroidia bacterium]|nr:tetratricopeptide repeat protein [Bacteroidia bacterium]
MKKRICHFFLITLFLPAGLYAQSEAQDFYVRGCQKSNADEAQAAIQDFNRAIELKPGYAQAYAQRGIAQTNARDYAAALEDFDQALRLQPDDADTYVNRGHVRNLLNKPKEAIHDYSRALKFNPLNKVALNNRGACRQELKQNRKAMRNYRKSLLLDTGFIPARLNECLLLKKTGHLQEAKIRQESALKQIFKKKSNRDTSDVLTKDSLNQIREMAQNNLTPIDLNMPQAEALRHRSLKASLLILSTRNPSGAQAHFDMGNAKADAGDAKGAVLDYDKAIELNPKFAEAYEKRGLEKLKLNLKEQACLDLSKAGELGYKQAYVDIRKLCH